MVQLLVLFMVVLQIIYLIMCIKNQNKKEKK